MSRVVEDAAETRLHAQFGFLGREASSKRRAAFANLPQQSGRRFLDSPQEKFGLSVPRPAERDVRSTQSLPSAMADEAPLFFRADEGLYLIGSLRRDALHGGISDFQQSRCHTPRQSCLYVIAFPHSDHPPHHRYSDVSSHSVDRHTHGKKIVIKVIVYEKLSRQAEVGRGASVMRPGGRVFSWNFRRGDCVSRCGLLHEDL